MLTTPRSIQNCVRIRFTQHAQMNMAFTREWNEGEAMKSQFCSVLDITLFFIFFISPRFIILFTLFYHFPVILYFFLSKRTPQRELDPRISCSRVKRSNRYTSQSNYACRIDWWVCWCRLTKRLYDFSEN